MATIAMTGRLRLSAARADAFMALGFTGVSFAAMFLLGLHLVAPSIDPVSSVMSDYALAERGGWMFAAGLAGISAAAVATALGLRAAGVASGRMLPFGLWLAAVSAVLAAVFPTEELPLTLTGEIHRYAAVTLLCTVPVIGALAAGSLTPVGELAAVRLRLFGTAAVAAVVLVAFLLSHLTSMPQDLQNIRGLLQRMTLVLELLVVAQLLALPRYCHAHAAAR